MAMAGLSEVVSHDDQRQPPSMPESAQVIIGLVLLGGLWTLFTGHLWHLGITVVALGIYFSVRYLRRWED
jgi:hypothetical protein